MRFSHRAKGYWKKVQQRISALGALDRNAVEAEHRRECLKLIDVKEFDDELARWWEACQLFDTNNNSDLEFDEYEYFHNKLVNAFNESEEEARKLSASEARRALLADWDRDSKGDGAVDKADFFLSIIELAVTWVEHEDESDIEIHYLEFLHNLFLRIFTGDPQQVKEDYLRSHQLLRGRRPSASHRKEVGLGVPTNPYPNSSDAPYQLPQMDGNNSDSVVLNQWVDHGRLPNVKSGGRIMHGRASITAIDMFTKSEPGGWGAAKKKLTPSYLRSIALMASSKSLENFEVPAEVEEEAMKIVAKKKGTKGKASKYAAQLKRGVGYHHRYNIDFTHPMKSNEMTHLHQNELSHHLRKQKWLTKSSNASKTLLIKYRQEQQMRDEKIKRAALKLKDTLKGESEHGTRKQKYEDSRRRREKMRGMVHRKDLRSERPKNSVETAKDIVMAWNTKKKDPGVAIVFLASKAGGGASGGGGSGSSSSGDAETTGAGGIGEETVAAAVTSSGQQHQTEHAKQNWLRTMVDTQEQRKTAFWVQQEMQRRARQQRRQQQMHLQRKLEADTAYRHKELEEKLNVHSDMKVIAMKQLAIPALKNSHGSIGNNLPGVGLAAAKAAFAPASPIKRQLSPGKAV